MRPHFVRDPLAEAVRKIPKDTLRLITPNVGGAFGMKAFVYPEQALVVWASRKLARAVKWQEDRSEGFVSDNRAATTARAPSSHSTRRAASLACVSPCSPISEPIYRRLAASSRHARQISSPASIRLRRSTSTSGASAQIRCLFAPIAGLGGPNDLDLGDVAAVGEGLSWPDTGDVVIVHRRR
jgi:hypothetical protein